MSASPDKSHKARQSQRTAFIPSVILLAAVWLLLTFGLLLIWFQGLGHISAFTIGFLVVFVAAWAYIPIQIARYFRDKRKQNDG